jgi:hypothetical protein
MRKIKICGQGRKQSWIYMATGVRVNKNKGNEESPVCEEDRLFSSFSQIVIINCINIARQRLDSAI